MIISTKKRTKRQNKAAYKQSLPAIRARARKRLRQQETIPKPKVEYNLTDLSPELIEKMGLNKEPVSEPIAPSLNE